MLFLKESIAISELSIGLRKLKSSSKISPLFFSNFTFYLYSYTIDANEDFQLFENESSLSILRAIHKAKLTQLANSSTRIYNDSIKDSVLKKLNPKLSTPSAISSPRQRIETSLEKNFGSKKPNYFSTILLEVQSFYVRPRWDGINSPLVLVILRPMKSFRMEFMETSMVTIK